MITSYSDTEMTGMVLWGQPSEDPNQPRMVEFALVQKNQAGQVRNVVNLLIKPDGWIIPPDATKIHGITTEMAHDLGVREHFAALLIEDMLTSTDLLVCHNIKFDFKIFKILAHNAGRPQLRQVLEALEKQKKLFCTMEASTPLCKIPGGRPYKWPKLTEAYEYFYQEPMPGAAHTSLADTKGCMKVHEAIIRHRQPEQVPA